MYFNNIKSLEELKKEYRKLSFIYHPDRPQGNLQVMQHINVEYEKMVKLLSKNETEFNSSMELKETLNKMVNVNGTIEIIGSWIWVTDTNKDDTYTRDTLKELKFRWNRKRNAWQWHSLEEGYKKNKSKLSKSEIEALYGVEKVRGKKAIA